MKRLGFMKKLAFFMLAISVMVFTFVDPNVANATESGYKIEIPAVTNGNVEAYTGDKLIEDLEHVEDNKEITLKLTPNEGYKFKNIIVQKEDGASRKSLTEQDDEWTVVDAGKEYKFKMPAAIVYVTVEFEEITYNIEVESVVANSGTVLAYDNSNIEAGAITKVAKGKTIKLEARPADGYRFKEWHVYNKELNTEITLTNDTFIMPENDIVIKVTFEQIPNTYKIILDANKGAFSNGETSCEYNIIDGKLDPAYTLNAISQDIKLENYKIIGWTVEKIKTNRTEENKNKYKDYLDHDKYIEADSSFTITEVNGQFSIKDNKYPENCFAIQPNEDNVFRLYAMWAPINYIKYSPDLDAAFNVASATSFYGKVYVKNDNGQYIPYETAGEVVDEYLFDGQARTLTANKYYRVGYRFLGWSKTPGKADNKAINYSNKKSGVNAQYYEGGKALQLYAVWEPIYNVDVVTHTITFPDPSRLTASDINLALREARDIGRDGNIYTVKVPAGEYPVETTMHIYSNTTLDLSAGAVFTDATGKSHNFLITGVINASDADPNRAVYLNYSTSDKCAGFGGFQNIKVVGGTFSSASTNASTILRFFHATNVTLEGVTVMGGGCEHQMETAAMNGFFIRNCTFKDLNKKAGYVYPQEAIQLDIPCSTAAFKDVYLDGTPSQNIEITGCVFSNVPKGIGSHNMLVGAFFKNVNISNNVFSNIKEEAIDCLNYVNCTISGNSITNCGAGIVTRFFSFPSYVRYAGANVYTSVFDGRQAYNGEIIHNANTKITGNTIKTQYNSFVDEVVGIQVFGYNLTKAAYSELDRRNVPADNYYMQGVTISNNTIASAGYGIHISDAVKCNVKTNTITQSGVSTSDSLKGKYSGILLDAASSKATIKGNKISNFKNSGIFVTGASKDNLITSNVIAGAKVNGITVNGNSSVKKMNSNTIKNCVNTGILIDGGSSVANMTSNKITNPTKYGIRVNASSNVTKMYKNFVSVKKKTIAGIAVMSKSTVGTLSTNSIKNNYSEDIGYKYGILIKKESNVKLIKSNKVYASVVKSANYGVYCDKTSTITKKMSGNVYKRIAVKPIERLSK